MNGATFYTAGKVGKSFSFDGVDDYFQSPATNLPTGNNNRTIMCWAKVNAFVTYEAFFAGYGNFGSVTQIYAIGTAGNNFVFFSQWGQAIFGPSIQTGQWYHVAATNVGNYAKLYLNGVLAASGYLTINTPANTQFYMGSLLAPYGQYRRLNGYIDEAQVFDRELSASEIQAIYIAGSDGICKPWRISYAGPEKTIFEGQNVQIGRNSVAGYSYSWSPAATLSNPGISNPIANPAINTTYYLTVTNINGCLATDSVDVTVKAPCYDSLLQDTAIFLEELGPDGRPLYELAHIATIRAKTLANKAFDFFEQ